MIRFFKRLWRRLPSNLSSASDFTNYSANFGQAIAFTRECGFATCAGASALSAPHEIHADNIRNALRAAGIKGLSRSAFQCLKWSYYLAPYLESELQRPVHVTIGQLWSDSQPLFNPTWKNLKDWSASGLTFRHIRDEGRRGVNLHAWLTVDSSEIIDISLFSSLASILPSIFSECNGRVIWGPAADILSSYQYLPMAVGRPFAEALDSGRELALLARSPSELYTYPLALPESQIWAWGTSFPRT